MKRYLKMIQTGLGLIVFALMFNNCSKVGFNSASSTPSAKGQTVGDLGIEGLEGAEVDQNKCEDEDDDDDDSCYALCHVPPGNAEAMHTIYVGLNALSAHLSNHVSHDDDSIKDEAGECIGEDAG
ncbi:MAG: hypothetical protein SGJ18_05980 [Pseudomonadota bacterium]|nr:hypothetical protein [Pseudomonadota bacterium]